MFHHPATVIQLHRVRATPPNENPLNVYQADCAEAPECGLVPFVQ
jgi:hypothetical protein